MWFYMLYEQSPLYFFFFNDTATTEIYTLSLHDALPIFSSRTNFSITIRSSGRTSRRPRSVSKIRTMASRSFVARSEEHTSELQSRQYLVCRLLLEKKKKKLLTNTNTATHR